MADKTNQHRVNRFDPTETPESDPVPTGEDIVNRQKGGRDTPRRYERPADDSSSKDAENCDDPAAL